MEYKFNAAWFVAGMLIVILGTLFMKYHQWVADNFGGGVGSYQKYKLAAVISIIGGLIASVNLHTIVLTWFFEMLFGGLSNS
jgi:hypothetical protein